METLERDESEPAAYPATPAGLSAAAAALDASMVWQRIESYIAHRWTARTVEWIAGGPGEFVPNLKPATIIDTQVWNGSAWEAVTLDVSPLGGLTLPGEGPYFIEATVGGGSVPADVEAAFVRLAEYMATEHRDPGTSRMSVDVGGAVIMKSRDPRWLARAMDYSGAGDLLRQYRRA